MRVYSFDRVTGAYVGTVYADPDPMQPGEWLFPAFTTHKEPPAFVAGKIAIYSQAAHEWSLVDVPTEPAAGASLLTEDDYAAVLRIAVARYANAVAVGYGFDSIDEAVSYADEPAVLLYQAQGRALRAWRSLLWYAVDQLLAQIASGDTPMPQSDVELFALLPKFTQQDIDDALAALGG